MSHNRRVPFLPVIIAVIVVLVGAIIWWFKPNNSSNASHQAQSTALDNQTSASFTELLFRGILCNTLVCLAVWCTYKLKSDSAKIAIIFLIRNNTIK